MVGLAPPDLQQREGGWHQGLAGGEAKARKLGKRGNDVKKMIIRKFDFRKMTVSKFTPGG